MEYNTVVIFDACVLYPAALRDLLIELAGRAFDKHLFHAKWTEKIHEEWLNSRMNSFVNSWIIMATQVKRCW